MTTTAYIGIGSNLGNRLVNCRQALGYLNHSTEVEVVGSSRWYESEAVCASGGLDQNSPPYVNGAAKIETTLTAHELLEFLRAIEVKMGREPVRAKEEPRTIDLDLLMYGQEIIAEEGLRVPHPQMAKRMFVLGPLCDIAPDAVHPGEGVTMRRLADALSAECGDCPIETERGFGCSG
jgi:2-amino-4-hydroxy-6-hydroxymethyldihydropteridine diphosphokinase